MLSHPSPRIFPGGARALRAQVSPRRGRVSPLRLSLLPALDSEQRAPRPKEGKKPKKKKKAAHPVRARRVGRSAADLTTCSAPGRKAVCGRVCGSGCPPRVGFIQPFPRLPLDAAAGSARRTKAMTLFVPYAQERRDVRESGNDTAGQGWFGRQLAIIAAAGSSSSSVGTGVGSGRQFGINMGAFAVELPVVG